MQMTIAVMFMCSKKEKDTFGLLPRFGLKVMANNVSK